MYTALLTRCAVLTAPLILQVAYQVGSVHSPVCQYSNARLTLLPALWSGSGSTTGSNKTWGSTRRSHSAFPWPFSSSPEVLWPWEHSSFESRLLCSGERGKGNRRSRTSAIFARSPPTISICWKKLAGSRPGWRRKNGCLAAAQAGWLSCVVPRPK